MSTPYFDKVNPDLADGGEMLQELLGGGEGARAAFLFYSCIGGAAIIRHAGGRLEVVTANDSFYAAAGTTRGEFAEKHPDAFSVFSPAGLQAAEDAFRLAEENGADNNFTADSARADGRARFRVRFLARKGEEAYFLAAAEPLGRMGAAAPADAGTGDIQAAATGANSAVYHYDVATGTMRIAGDADKASDFPALLKNIPYNPERPDIPGGKPEQEYLDFFHAIINGEEGRTLEIRRILADGRPHWLRGTYNLVRDHNGRTVSAVILFANIDEQKNKLLAESARANAWQTVIEAVSNQYQGFFYITLTDGRYRYFGKEGVMADEVLREQDAAKSLAAYVKIHVEPEFITDASNFTDLATLPGRLEQAKTLFHDYRRRNIGWVRGTFSIAGRDDNGKINAIVYGIQFIDDIKKKEYAAMHSLRERLVTIEALVNNFLCCYYVDFQLNTYMEIKSPENLRTLMPGDGERKPSDIFTLMRELSKPEYQREIDHFFSLSTLPTRLSASDNVEMEFETAKSGWLRMGFSRTALDCDGNASEAVFYVRTIGKEREKEIKRQKSLRERLTIINAMNEIYDLTVYIDIDGGGLKPLKYPPALAAAISRFVRPGDFLKDFLDNWVLPDDIAEVKEFLDLSTLPVRLADAQNVSAECRIKDAGWVRLRFIRAESVRGAAARVIFTVQRIGAEKERELRISNALRDAFAAAERASAAKTDFLARISHDIRTPMNGIMGMTMLAVANQDNPEKVAHCLEKISESSKHLLELINEILDISRIEDGRIELADDNFRLTDLADNIMTMVKPLTTEKQQAFSFDVYDVTHEEVTGDRARLQEVFLNLISNSIKFTPEKGEIAVALTEKYSHNNICFFELSVSDTGIGMTPEFIEHIFEPFTRAANTGKIEGSGLGLTITKNIVRMMNGSIAIESAPEKGSKFTVTFCLKYGNIEMAKQHALPGRAVLMVSENQAACNSVSSLLNNLGMKGEFTQSIPDAVARAAARHSRNDDYFTIMIDWINPGTDISEAARRFRASAGHAVKLVVLTSLDWTGVESPARGAGIDEFVSKPLFQSQLANLFVRLTDGRAEPRNTDPLALLSAQNFSGKHALMAEDNDISAEISTEILGITGLLVERVENGQDAVDKFANSQPGYYDIILMDIQMPSMDGYEAARAIRSLHRPDAATVPIVAMTANAFVTDITAAKAAGMNEHIAKPIDLQQVTQVMQRMLSGCLD